MGKRLADTGTTLLAGRVYAIVHAQWSSIHSAIAATLISCEQVAERVWVSGHEIELERALSSPHFAGVRNDIDSGALRLFISDADAASSPQRVLEELEFFGLKQRSLALIENADSFFGATGDLARWRHWAEQHGCTLVLMCNENVGIVERILRCADRLAGFARIRDDGTNAWWEVIHWFGREEMIAHRSFRLHLEEGGGLVVDQDDSLQNTPMRGVDEALVIAENAALKPTEATPEGWTVVENLTRLMEVSAKVKAATLVLAFDRETPFDELTRVVFNLRRSRGRQIKIVVREVERHLRHSQEQLLIKVGANLVVPPAVSFSRFLNLTAAIQGQSYQHALPADYSEAVSHLANEAEQGYLAPEAFVKAVERTLKQSAKLGIENAFVRLPLPDGLTATAALSLFAMTRPGDLCTADNENLYLFLFACHESDVELALERLFDVPVAELFEDETRCFSAETIRQGIEHLVLSAARAPDLGTLATQSAAPAVAEAEKRATLECDARGARAQRRPLSLKPERATEKGSA